MSRLTPPTRHDVEVVELWQGAGHAYSASATVRSVRSIKVLPIASARTDLLHLRVPTAQGVRLRHPIV